MNLLKQYVTRNTVMNFVPQAGLSTLHTARVDLVANEH